MVKFYIGDTRSYFHKSTIAFRFNIPLDRLIDTALIDMDTSHWEQVRSRPLEYFRYRGIFSALGLMNFLACLIFDKS